mmetsp:Transcript_6852/g.13213  ORF Transcript_6852/g.13213 Transcript_6852/m.13213 type:complete len:276 (+) Transcript_6852:268-1095(+)
MLLLHVLLGVMQRLYDRLPLLPKTGHAKQQHANNRLEHSDPKPNQHGAPRDDEQTPNVLEPEHDLAPARRRGACQVVDVWDVLCLQRHHGALVLDVLNSLRESEVVCARDVLRERKPVPKRVENFPRSRQRPLDRGPLCVEVVGALAIQQDIIRRALARLLVLKRQGVRATRLARGAVPPRPAHASVVVILHLLDCDRLVKERRRCLAPVHHRDAVLKVVGHHKPEVRLRVLLVQPCLDRPLVEAVAHRVVLGVIPRLLVKQILHLGHRRRSGDV